MPKFRVEKAVEIAAPLSEVFATVRDFHSWPSWSPWLIVEPDCEVHYESSGDAYSWEGDVVGAGRMQVRSESENERIEYDLEFLKPWKSRADVLMLFSELETGDSPRTRVVWTMESALPLFLFWMKNSLAGLIAMDYERGLAMMRERIETGQVASSLEYSRRDLDPFLFVGIRATCGIAELGPSMEANIEKLDDWIAESEGKPTGALRSFYHKWDVVKQTVVYSVGYPVSKAPETLPAGMTKSAIPSLKTFAVTHTGPYHHLGNAWAAGMLHGRAGKFKQLRGIHPFEVYESRREDTPAGELVTTVHFPIR